MVKRQGTAVYGANTAGVDESIEPFDIECPFMKTEGRSGNNYWKSHCMIRLKMHENDDICGECELIGRKPKEKYPNTVRAIAVTPQEAHRLGAVWLKQYKKGKTFKQIAEKAGCSPSTARQYMLLAGYVPKQRPPTYKP